MKEEGGGKKEKEKRDFNAPVLTTVHQRACGRSQLGYQILHILILICVLTIYRVRFDQLHLEQQNICN